MMPSVTVPEGRRVMVDGEGRLHSADRDPVDIVADHLDAVLVLWRHGAEASWVGWLRTTMDRSVSFCAADLEDPIVQGWFTALPAWDHCRLRHATTTPGISPGVATRSGSGNANLAAMTRVAAVVVPEVSYTVKAAFSGGTAEDTHAHISSGYLTRFFQISFVSDTDPPPLTRDQLPRDAPELSAGAFNACRSSEPIAEGFPEMSAGAFMPACRIRAGLS